MVLLQLFVKRLFQTRLAKYEMADQLNNHDVLWDPPIVSGCFMLFRTDVLQQLEGLTLAFFSILKILTSVYVQGGSASCLCPSGEGCSSWWSCIAQRLAAYLDVWALYGDFLQYSRLALVVMSDIKSTVLVTGANGFVGKAVCEHLLSLGVNVKGAVRSHPLASYHINAPSLTADANWTTQLQQVDVVIHCAARVHVMSDKEADPLTAFRAVKHNWHIKSRKPGRRCWCWRFIFISSIKVNGEQTGAR